MKEYLEKIKNKYNYSNQNMEMISKVIMAFINVLGEENINIILTAFENTTIFYYDDTLDAANKLNKIANDGNEYKVGLQATGTGFMQDYYTYENNQINQKFAVGIAKSNQNLQTFIHEMCHVLSTIGKIKVDNNQAYVFSGLSIDVRKIENGKIGEVLSCKANMFNEMVTENLAMQIMDFLEPGIEHVPTAYKGYVGDLQVLFRDERFNKVIINDYLKSSSNFALVFENAVSKEQFDDEVNAIASSVDTSDSLKQYCDYLKTLSVKEFLEIFISNLDRITAPAGMDRQTFKDVKRINRSIFYDLSQKIVESEYAK